MGTSRAAKAVVGVGSVVVGDAEGDPLACAGAGAHARLSQRSHASSGDSSIETKRCSRQASRKVVKEKRGGGALGDQVGRWWRGKSKPIISLPTVYGQAR